MYLGRFTIGQEVVIPLHTTDATPGPITPARAPSIKVFDGAGTLVFKALFPSLDSVRSVGLFEFRLALDATFSVRRYLCVLGYAAGGVNHVKVCHFDVAPGGDAAGAVISMYHLERPQAATIVEKTDAGRRLLKRSPYL